ncbi:MAG: hypothetical protein K0R57_734 [Paenibacillaceae bacterium]|jgi:hypothetical protein|nr:hypothetical protein [Paenibacillaceae bacterium]
MIRIIKKQISLALVYVLVAALLLNNAAAAHAVAGEDNSIPNLVSNPGGESTTLEPWVTSPATGVGISRETAIKRTGEASIRFTPRDGQFGNLRQQITLVKGVEYQFTAWVRFNNAYATGNNVAMKLDYNNSTDKTYKVAGSSYPQVASVENTGSEWIKLQGTHKYEGNLAQVTLWLYFEPGRDSSSPVYLDDVSVQPVPVPYSLSITGEASLPIPQQGYAAASYSAGVYNQFGTGAGMEDEEVVWSLVEPAAGVLLQPTGGQSVSLSVYAEALAGVVSLRAALASNGAVFTDKQIIIGTVDTGSPAYYVDPVHGDDSNPGTEAAPFQTIERARDEVRLYNSLMSGSITIFLRGGEYNYADRYTVRQVGQGTSAYTIRRSELTFDQRDSGKNGYDVIYKAYPGEKPVISGGRQVEGWTLHDAGLNIYKAHIGVGTDTRQFYVNGTRAIVARSEGSLPGLTLEPGYGHTTTSAQMAGWDNQSDIEFVYHSHWMEHRIKADAITADNGLARISMNPDRWAYALNTGIPSIKEAANLQYIENAYELLDSEGEWYLDKTAGDLYYKPRSGEDMSAADAVIPVVDELLTARGSGLDQRFEHVRFEGISFEYAGWLRPNQIKAHHSNQNNTMREAGNVLPEGAVTIETAAFITFERNEFAAMGSTGLLMKNGIRDSSVVGNTFHDISGSGINMEDPMIALPEAVQADPRLMLERVTIRNNYIRKIGVEYRASTGISMALGKNIYIGHNEISDIPYTGIHTSWHTDGITENITIENNYIHDLMQGSIYDGGAIYTLGVNAGSLNQPAYTVQNNYIRNQLNLSGALFPDNRSTWWLARNNVIDLKDSPVWTNGASPRVIHIHSVESSNHRFINNYVTTEEKMFNGTNNTIEQMQLHPDGIWPLEALRIIANAGLEEPYRDLWDTESRFNLLLNSGFETRQSNVWEAESAAWETVSSEHREGVKAARVTPASPQGHLFQNVALYRGLNYRASAWVKLAEGESRLAGLYADFGQGQPPVKLAEGLAGTDGWVYLQGEYTHAGTELSASARIYVQLSAEGGAAPYYLDEIRFTENNEAGQALLQAAVQEAGQLHAGAVEGAGPGQYASGSKSQLLQGINDAAAVAGSNPQPGQAYHALKQLYAVQIWFRSQQEAQYNKDMLGSLIQEGNQLVVETAVGKLAGMVTQQAQSSFLGAIASAQAVYAEEAAAEQISAGFLALEQAMNTFKAARVVLDETLLEQLLQDSQQAIDSSEEGSEPGQYAAGAKAQFQLAIDHVSAQLAEAREATAAVVGMLQDPTGWRNGAVEQGDNQAQIKGRGLKYTGQTFLNEMFETDLEYQYVSSGDWPGFAIRSQSLDTTVGAGETSYLFSFKRDVWELQKWVDGQRTMLIGAVSGYTPRWGTLANTHIESGVKHRLRFGAENVENGVRLLMMVDGETVFDYVDELEPIRTEGYFSVYATANPITFYYGALSSSELERLYGIWLEAAVQFEAAKVEENAPLAAVFRNESGQPVDRLPSDQLVTVELELDPARGLTEDTMVIAALYDHTDKMSQISFLSVRKGDHAPSTLTAGFRTPAELTGFRLKVFLWEGKHLGDTSMRPLSEAVVLLPQ